MRGPGKLVACILMSTALCTAESDRIQSPDASWKTMRTANYRIHYPANPKGGFEQFAAEVASKIEGIHAKVAEWVGYEEKGPTNVLIIDPKMEANGATVPLLNRPLVVLFKTEPEPDSGIGHYSDWVDLLVTHELAHLHHLMRPQNGRANKLRNFFLPLGPIALKAPRLVSEGYATLIEGRITGSGRPHSAYRSAVIRQWALQGRLPGYGAVSTASGFRGGQMAYLLGSAYLEWLERQNLEEPDILKKFWRQLASKKRRSYDDSFKATFGLDPEDSYYRWRAEVVHDAIAFEQAQKAKGLIREGRIVARFDTEISGLALSPDGTKLMARVLASGRPGIRIWDLDAEPKPNKKNNRAKTEEDDPNEVEDREPEFIEPKILTVLGKRNGIMPHRAWWTGDDQVTFEMRAPNKEGFLTPSFLVADLSTKTVKPVKMPLPTKSNEYAWKEIDGIWNVIKKLPNGGEQQITRVLSAAWQPAATPDGKALYYVQLTAMGCEIRKLDLDQPELEPAALLVPANLLVQDAILSQPDTLSLLPPPSNASVRANDYSVFDSHKLGRVTGYSSSPSDKSLMVGFGGSDLLGRLNWFAVGSFGAAQGPRGGTVGVMYRGWPLAPSLQVFSSYEKPSAQRYEPVRGFDRERYGAELAITLQQKGMSPAYIRPFIAWETTRNVNSNLPGINRYMAGFMGGYAVQRSRGKWGIGINGNFQGAFGRTDRYINANSAVNWKISRLEVTMPFMTPVGLVSLTAEDGRIDGDYGPMDVFRLGGQNTGLVPDSLVISRVQQPALPAFLQAGDRMRKLRADYGSIGHIYYERVVAWYSFQTNIDYQSLLGVEIRFHEALDLVDALGFLYGPTISKITLGVHRPMDGIMKDRARNNAIWTINVSIALNPRSR